MKHPAAAFYEKFDYETQGLYDKTVLVTGGTTGIGRTIALLLASQGAHVIIFGRHEQELNDALEDIYQVKGETGKAIGLQADISKINDIQRVFKEVDKQFKKLDILINTAAVGFEDLLHGSKEEWQYIVNTTLLGYMACAREAIGRMKAAGDGHIVNIGSLNAHTREGGDSVYVATKSAIQGFSEALGKGVSQMGIKVTLIEPGAAGTDMTENPPQEQREMDDQLKMLKRKMLKAEDIAACVFYTLTQPKPSDETSVIIRPQLQEGISS